MLMCCYEQWCVIAAKVEIQARFHQEFLEKCSKDSVRISICAFPQLEGSLNICSSTILRLDSLPVTVGSADAAPALDMSFLQEDLDEFMYIGSGGKEVIALGLHFQSPFRK